VCIILRIDATNPLKRKRHDLPTFGNVEDVADEDKLIACRESGRMVRGGSKTVVAVSDENRLTTLQVGESNWHRPIESIRLNCALHGTTRAQAQPYCDNAHNFIFSATTSMPASMWHPVVSKRLANAHAKCVTVPALGNIGSKIQVVLFT
jgi:hypothetical protein